jgi:hypothetical protein
MNYRIEWIAGPVFLGAVLLPVLVPPFALIAVVIVALAAAAALVVVAGAVLASPYLLVRSLRRHLAERRPSIEISGTLKPSVPVAPSFSMAAPETDPS